MQVLFASSEIQPLAKTGGLADVSAALPAALADLGVDVELLMPGYPQALDMAEKKSEVVTFDDILGHKVRLVRGRTPDTGLPVWLLDCPPLYERAGGPYQDADGNEWPDNALRFAVLNHVAARVGLGVGGIAWQPDIVHANDWHVGLVPALLRPGGLERPASVFTIHNMAYQGLFPFDIARRVGMSAEICNPNDLEFYGHLSFLKSGIGTSDRITTVSPTYAKEIVTPDYGHGLDGLLRHRAHRLSGILNGVDYDIWEPSTDPFIAQPYGADRLGGKAACKADLQDYFGLDIDPERPIVAFMSRLADQKMADCVLAAVPWIVEQGAQFVMVAQGDRALESGFLQAAEDLPQLGIQIGYNEPSAHRLLAGADILLAPSRFEPCGLTHLYGMRYGAVPVVRKTGGLADTVTPPAGASAAIEAANGFVFDEPTTGDMIGALEQALEANRYDVSWRRLRLNAMAADFGWEASARQYLDLYRDLIESRDLGEEQEERDTIRRTG